MFILEKEKFNKFLIVLIVLLLSIFAFSMRPVYASNSVSEDEVKIDTRSNYGIQRTRFYNVEMSEYPGTDLSLTQITFNAEFKLDIAEIDQILIDQNFSENYASFKINHIFFTGFKFEYEAKNNNDDSSFIHGGRVNMITEGDLSSWNTLDGFARTMQYYEIVVKGQSVLASDPSNSVDRDLVLNEGLGRFPFATPFYDLGFHEYGNRKTGGVLKNLLGEDDEYLNFKPTELVLRFEDVSFAFDPLQSGFTSGLGLSALGSGFGFNFYQSLTNFDYDHERTVDKGMNNPTPGLPPAPRINFDIVSSLMFKHKNESGGGVGGLPLIPGPGSGSLFSIIPSIMIAIFSFFWVIGGIELGGIPGLTLVGITTFFVSFMVIKIILGLFKGGGD